MNNFDAFIKGTRQNGVKTYYAPVVLEDFGITKEHSEAFRLGLELNACWQMMMSANSLREFEGDVADYDDCVERINVFFSAPVVRKMVTEGPVMVTITHPDTGEEKPAEFFGDVNPLKLKRP